MLKNIVLHLGNYRNALLIRNACDTNRELLGKLGVRHANFLPLTPLLLATQSSPKTSLEAWKHHPYFVQHREYLSKQVAEAGSDCHTIILLHYNAAFLFKSILPFIYAAVAESFPGAIKAFISLSRQDKALEAEYAYTVMHSNTHLAGLREYLLTSDYYCYDESLEEMYKTFNRDNVTCYVEDKEHLSTLDAQDYFWKHLNICPPTSASDDANFAPRLLLELPQEFYLFCSACNTLRSEWYEYGSSPWEEQTLHFADWPVPHGPFSPEERATLIKRYERGNAIAAKMLGRGPLFDLVTTDEPYERITNLTPETAFMVAARLDRDFARARLKEFHATPIHYLTRDQRLCWQALHDVIDSPSAAPPTFLRRAEPKLSVLTLTYNHAAYIVECIESIIAQQTDFPIQHIIADNASNDNTQDIILDYAARHPHIVPVLRKERHCPANVRALFEMARSPYVAICDGDDYFTDPDKLQTQVDFLDAHPDCALCFHPVRVTYEDDPSRERFYPPLEELPRGVRQFYYLSDLIKCNIIQTNSVMYRWRFKDGLPDWFRTDLMPGDWYWHLLHAETGKIGFINKVMSVYRRHKESVYYLSEVDRLKHRHTVGKKELEAYDAVNEHFKHRFEPIILDLTNGVFADCLLHCNQIEDNTLLEELVEKFPRFARHFLGSLKVVSGKRPPQGPSV